MIALNIIFGITITNLSLYFGRIIVVEVFKDETFTERCLPSGDEIQQYILAIMTKHSTLKHV